MEAIRVNKHEELDYQLVEWTKTAEMTMALMDFSGETRTQRASRPLNTNELSRHHSSPEGANGVAPKRGMVLPFTPLAMSFDNVNYFVDMPAVSVHVL